MIILGMVSILKQPLNQDPNDRVIPPHDDNFVVATCECRMTVYLKIVQLRRDFVKKLGMFWKVSRGAVLIHPSEL